MSADAVDFAEIEVVKENVQPLRSGRNPKDLAKQVKGLKAQPLTSTVSVFEEACKEWEDKLAAYGGSDPLEVWDEYIKWAQQNATSDKLSEQVVSLLQRCTRKFQASQQYKEDPRYLRIWIKYIDTVNDPADIFEFLEANQIGTGLALFYTSWALVLELKKSMYAEAYQKLDQGLQRKAHPVEKVQLALKDFQHRMNQRTIETMKAASLDSKPAEEPKRGREFGDQLTKTRQVARPAPAVSSASSVAGTTARRGLGGTGGSARSAQVQGTGNKAGFSIFCDDGADSAGAGAAKVRYKRALIHEKEPEKSPTKTIYTKETYRNEKEP
jgi:checkpoint serine/threonine-protein kinase